MAGHFDWGFENPRNDYLGTCNHRNPDTGSYCDLIEDHKGPCMTKEGYPYATYWVSNRSFFHIEEITFGVLLMKGVQKDLRGSQRVTFSDGLSYELKKSPLWYLYKAKETA